MKLRFDEKWAQGEHEGISLVSPAGEFGALRCEQGRRFRKRAISAMKNHFLPEFYFRPWLDAGGHLLQFSRAADGEIVFKKKTPGQICYQHDLHTLSDEFPEDKRHIVETWLKNSIDDLAAPAIKKILDGGLPAIDEKEAHAVVGLILSMLVRTPEKVAYLQQHAPAVWKAAMEREDEKIRAEHAGADGGSPMTLAEYADLHLPGVVDNAGNFLITDITASQEYWERLFKCAWWVADFSGTSVDNQPASDRGVTVMGTGLLDPNMSVTLPLSPHKVLYLTSEAERDRCQAEGIGRLGLITMRCTIGGAKRFVFGTEGTNSNLIDKWLIRGV